MKTFTTCLLLAVLSAVAWLPARAQLVLVRQVSSSTGLWGKAGNILVDYTVGEPVVMTHIGPRNLLTQGFQQFEVLPAPPNGVNRVLQFSVYPNPALTTTGIRLDLSAESSVTIQIINTAGQIVYQDFRKQGAGKATIPVNVDKLGAGIYTLLVKVDGYARTEKLIIQ